MAVSKLLSFIAYVLVNFSEKYSILANTQFSLSFTCSQETVAQVVK